jgi:hypothetical protein
VVVGARVLGGAIGGLVYYVDPLDGSHPDNVEQQKIYVMSYRGFTEKIANLHNKMTVDLDFKQRQFSSKVGYGLHGPRGPLTI